MYSISRVCDLLFRHQSLYADKADLAERIFFFSSRRRHTRFPGYGLPMGPCTTDVPPWCVAHTTRGCPIQSRSLRLGGVAMLPAIPLSLRSSKPSPQSK